MEAAVLTEANVQWEDIPNVPVPTASKDHDVNMVSQHISQPLANPLTGIFIVCELFLKLSL